MQYSAALDGTTATITTNNCGISTALTITDAANLAADLAPFASGDAPAVDRSTSTFRGTITPTSGAQHSGGSRPYFYGTGDLRPTHGDQRNRDVQVQSRGYILEPTDSGVQIITPAGTGQSDSKVAIPRDQIASIIAQLNA